MVELPFDPILEKAGWTGECLFRVVTEEAGWMVKHFWESEKAE